jgi:hypothetical protein
MGIKRREGATGKRREAARNEKEAPGFEGMFFPNKRVEGTWTPRLAWGIRIDLSEAGSKSPHA